MPLTNIQLSDALSFGSMFRQLRETLSACSFPEIHSPLGSCRRRFLTVRQLCSDKCVGFSNLLNGIFVLC